MTAKRPDREKPDAIDGDLADSRRIINDQRDVNEMLVLATIRAEELAEKAATASKLAEAATRKAKREKRRAERAAVALRDSERELREEGKFRELLIAIVGHDLGNPLAVIKMSASSLEQAARGSELTKAVALIGQCTDSILRMVAQLLDLTRARHFGVLPLHLRPSDMREICKRVADELQVVSDRPIRLVLDGNLEGMWDADRLCDVLSNICRNAIDHAAVGTEVVIAASAGEGEVIVEISNQGDPIAEEMLPFLFQPFRSLRQRERSKTSNLGLGLYIAHEVVRSHGGSLAARSVEGTTSFTMRLPL